MEVYAWYSTIAYPVKCKTFETICCSISIKEWLFCNVRTWKETSHQDLPFHNFLVGWESYPKSTFPPKNTFNVNFTVKTPPYLRFFSSCVIYCCKTKHIFNIWSVSCFLLAFLIGNQLSCMSRRYTITWQKCSVPRDLQLFLFFGVNNYVLKE